MLTFQEIDNFFDLDVDLRGKLEVDEYTQTRLIPKLIMQDSVL